MSDATDERVELLAARNAALVIALRGLVRYVRRAGGYMGQADQECLRWAEHVLEENTR